MLKLTDKIYKQINLEFLTERTGELSIIDEDVVGSNLKLNDAIRGWYILTKEEAIKLRDYLNENYPEE